MGLLIFATTTYAKRGDADKTILRMSAYATACPHLGKVNLARLQILLSHDRRCNLTGCHV
jgi:hypothetical protein